MLPIRMKVPTAKWTALVMVAALMLFSCKPKGGEDDNNNCKPKEKGLASIFSSSDSKKDKEKCDTDDGDNDNETPNPNPNPNPQPIPELPGLTCTIDRFKQNNSDQERIKKLDLLFVMDHSGSMKDDWARVANNVQNLVRELPADMDIRYAVLLANGSSWMGHLYAPVGMTAVLNNQKHSINTISNNLHKIFVEGMKESDNIGTGEASFLSLQHAVTTHAVKNQKLGFFRADAALSILFMSDEQEIGFPFPNPQAPGLPPRCDAAQEDSIKRKYYDAKGINIDSAFNAVKAMKGDMPIVTHAFVNITKQDLFMRNSKNASCLYDSLGYGYFEMVEKTKGVLFSIQANKAEGMAQCGRVIRERLQLVHDFPLSKPSDKVDAATILAHVDGAQVAHEYRAATNIVHLNNAGVGGSDVEIRHCEPVVRQEWTMQNVAGQAGQYAASLSWKTPEHATRGKVRWGTQANALDNEVLGANSATDHAVTIPGLNPNTVYYFQAISSDEYGVEKRSNVINLRTLPDWSLSGLNGQPSRSTVNISWATLQYATHGKVLYGVSSDALVNETAETAAVNQHNVMVEGLNANTTYYFRCVSRDEYGLEKKSDVFAVRTLNDWGLVGFQGDAARNSVRLQWQTPEYVTTGKVMWGTSPNALSNQLASPVVGSNHVLTVNGLNPNTMYYFQAVAQDDLGLVKRSDILAIRTLVDWNITGFQGSSTQDSVAVTWNTVEYATSGKVVWGVAPESLTGQAPSAGPAMAHSAVIGGLAPDTLYYFQAISQDEFGLVKASAVVAIRTQPKPVEPPVLPVWEMTDFHGLADKTSVSVGWKTSAYATTGKILWGTSENNLNHQVAEDAAFKDHALMVTGLTADTLYYFQAVSVDDFGQEKRTEVIAVRTLAEPPTEPPPVGDWQVVGFDATTTPTTADVIWQTPGASTKATLKIGLSPTDLSLQTISVDNAAETHLLPVSGLTPNTVYYLQVIAVDSVGRTVESVVIMKRTKVQ